MADQHKLSGRCGCYFTLKCDGRAQTEVWASEISDKCCLNLTQAISDPLF